ncbi:MAG: EAL domain-containing protein [Eubacterium sp.]|nr:EAL domain-containing protein [Eubacterium sp.]
MNRVMYFDISAIVIILILIFSLFFRHMYRGRVNMTFTVLLFVILLNSICDVLSTRDFSFIENPSMRNYVRMTISTLYFIFRLSEGPLYFLFISFLSGSWNRIRKKAGLVRIAMIPYFFGIGFLIANLFLKNIFYYDAEGNYSRANLIILIYVIGGFYLLLALILLLSTRVQLEREKFYALLSMFVLQFLAIGIQYFFPNYLLEMFSMAIMGLLVTIVVLRPEEDVDFTTGARSYNAFSRDMHRILHAERSVDLIFIRLQNNSSLISLLGNEGHRQLLKEVTEFLDPEDRLALSNPRELYYLYAGLFAISIEKKGSETPVMKEAKRVLLQLREDFKYRYPDLEPDIRIGILHCPEDINHWEDLISFANTYDRIDTNSPIVSYSDLAPNRQYRVTAEIDNIIGRALTNESFVLYYQPIYSVKDGRFTTAEALIRLIDEKEGMISPGLFIPAAERNGTIHRIGDFVIQDVCRFIKDHDLNRLGLKYIEVNLSTVQCMRNNVVDRIVHFLDENNVDPCYINLEVTETASNFVHDTVQSNIQSLHTRGLDFALDDYGTGYSNLQRVVDMPFRMIKLDKHFVDDWEEPRMRSVIQNTIRMIKDLGDEIVVEGVETREAAEWFAEQGCDFIQGFYYARPMPEKEFLSFLKSQEDRLEELRNEANWTTV